MFNDILNNQFIRLIRLAQSNEKKLVMLKYVPASLWLIKEVSLFL